MPLRPAQPCCRDTSRRAARSRSVVYPIDSIRRRMMMEAGRSKPLYRSSLDCARLVWKTEGYRGFYRGLLPNMARGIGTSALLVLYDEIRVALNTN